MTLTQKVTAGAAVYPGGHAKRSENPTLQIATASPVATL